MRNRNSIFFLMFVGMLISISCGGGGSTAPPVTDTSPPQWDSTIGIQDFDPQDGEVTIHWGSATDSESPPVRYFLFFDTDPDPWDAVPVIVSDINSYTFTGLLNGTEYWAGVRCQDKTDPPNVDTNDVVLKVIPAIPDNEPPQWDSNVGIMSVSTGNGVVSIEWGTATDTQNNPVEYLLYIDYDSDPWDTSPLTFMTNNPYTFTGLKNSKTYWFGVRCCDSFVKPNTDTNEIVLSVTFCDGGDPSDSQYRGTAPDFTNIVDLVTQNGFVYMIDDDGKFSILNVMEPGTPITTGSLMLGDHDEDSIDVQGHYAFISADNLYVINISDHSSPVIENSLDISMEKIEVQGSYLYGIYPTNTGGFSGLRIIDVSYPSAPQTTGSVDLAMAMGGPNYSEVITQTVNGNYAYVVTFQSFIASSTIGNNLHIIDVNDPAQPSETGSLFFPSWEISKPHANQDYVTFYIEYKDEGGNGIGMIDVSDPFNPIEAGFHNLCNADNSLEVYCGYAYELCANGLFVISVSNPSNIFRYTEVDVDGINCTDVKVDSGFAYIAHRNDGLLIYQLWQ